MGFRRPRTLLLGLAVGAAALGGQHVGASAPAGSRVLHGTVSASGLAPASPAWRVEHPGDGVYRVVVLGADIEVDVPEWDRAADVTIVPMGRGIVELRFTQGRTRVDTDFSFVALARD